MNDPASANSKLGHSGRRIIALIANGTCDDTSDTGTARHRRGINWQKAQIRPYCSTNRGRMTGAAPEVAPPSPNFRSTPMRGRLNRVRVGLHLAHKHGGSFNGIGF
ncbi:hypothetical protein AVEN_207505-1 [Araneus ventricosus]|uniref:Uncharacterized protein n=1 Tax=Araneus ventricosus TaxID=182803 RepID=A0A4Y2V4V8_ARAVE|nr:hypothetical protein AVEN_207505-1 [Araneus ventricosus]